VSGAVEVVLERVTKRFGGVTAVDNVSVRHGSGGVLGLIGPNGAGKTTLFNILSGITEPTSGRILLDGHVITGERPDRIAHRGIARTFQNLQVFGSLTVLDNVTVAAAAAAGGGGLWRNLLPLPSGRTMARTHEDEARTLLGQVGVAHLAGTTVTNLPYGLQRRVEIARALATRPRLLLLDEPLAGLSRAESSDLAQLFRDLVRSDLTVILVEHDVATVMQVSDRVVVLDHGNLLADGTPTMVQSDPRVRAAYLGEEEPA
jgi:branched-chain amino acid transport system ATP-binding protein